MKMEEHYSKMSVLSICSNIKYVSVIRGSGDTKSSDKTANLEMSRRLPDLIDSTNHLVYDLQRSR